MEEDVASVDEIDDAITFGPGLQGADGDVPHVSHAGGGEEGMRHFLAQFGPALQWPWTKLTDVPELDDELIDKIASQSDAQAEGLSVRELERIRDDNLVALLQALRAPFRGRGDLHEHEVRLFEAHVGSSFSMSIRARRSASMRPPSIRRGSTTTAT